MDMKCTKFSAGWPARKKQRLQMLKLGSAAQGARCEQSLDECVVADGRVAPPGAEVGELVPEGGLARQLAQAAQAAARARAGVVQVAPRREQARVAAVVARQAAQVARQLGRRAERVRRHERVGRCTRRAVVAPPQHHRHHVLVFEEGGHELLRHVVLPAKSTFWDARGCPLNWLHPTLVTQAVLTEKQKLDSHQPGIPPKNPI